MARELEGKVAVVTGAASGIGLASTEAMVAAGARVVMVDRDEAALKALCNKYGDAVIPLVIDLLDPKDCATLLLQVMKNAGQLDILHANAGTYVGGDLVDADSGAIDRMLNLNVNVVMKNVHDVLPHMIERQTGDIIITSSLAAHFPTPWEPVYASSKWAINCFVQTVRRQVFKHGIRVGSISPGPVISALLADWPPEKLKEAKESGSLLEASEVASVVLFMLTRPRGMTIRDVVMLPTNFDLQARPPKRLEIYVSDQAAYIKADLGLNDPVREAVQKNGIALRLEPLQSPINEAEYRRAFEAVKRVESTVY